MLELIRFLREYFYLSVYAFVFFSFLWVVFYKKKYKFKIILALLSIGSGLATYAYYIEPHILKAKKQDIYLSENKENFIKIALVSDIHRGHFKNGIGIERIVKKVKQQQPDVVFILGDFLGDLSLVQKELSYFKQLDIPIYTIMGNHEAYAPDYMIEQLSPYFEKNNITLLRNNKLNIKIKGQNFELVGLEDLEFKGVKGVDWSLLEGNPLGRRIVLAHNPNTALFLKEAHRFDVMFSGHTHGGQVNVGVPSHDSATGQRFFILEGYKKIDQRQYYVSAGIGMTVLPIRFMRPPRIDVIQLYY